MATRLRLARSKAPTRVFGTDLHVGSRPRLWAPHHLEIGDHGYLGHDVCIETNCRIGKYVIIANNVALVGRRDPRFPHAGRAGSVRALGGQREVALPFAQGAARKVS
ncbi:MAG: hypothetical protein U1F25_04000 [Rubrivivax sp.]